ncbi:PilW family protein [Kistimonas asteriae]|uniref:PilW family protein n=1 Tax=Kistimonas asteriae TaxID=517724 RepID=UPI001BAD2826|nr:PilW family protein [Kistimonas asteriae]
MQTTVIPQKRLLHHQQGLSVIELLIASTLSLLLLLGVSQIVISNKETFSVNESLGYIMENGRFSLGFIANSIRMAGHTESDVNAPRHFPAPDCNIPTTSDAACNAAGTGNTADRLAVQYWPVAGTSGTATDCIGNDVTGQQITEVFTIEPADAPNGNPYPSLACRAYSHTNSAWTGTTQRLVDGIDNLQLLYGVDTDSNGSINQYVSADRVNANAWDNVRAVRIALLASAMTSTDNPQQQFLLLDAPTITTSDGITRQLFTTTVTVKN